MTREGDNMLKIKSFHFFVCVIAAVGFFILSGCVGRSQPARFYTLSPLSESQIQSKISGSAAEVAIGIRSVTLADYIDQFRIVTRSGDNRINRAEFDLWSGSLKDNLTNVFAENIGYVLSTDKVTIYPWRQATPLEYQIAVDIIRFDGQINQEAVLVARWRVFNGEGKKLLVQKRSDIRERAGDSYEELVAAQSRALGQLSYEIAEAITVAKRQEPNNTK